MNPVFIFLFFINVVIEVSGNGDYVPALIWTSREFLGRKNIDYLVSKKIKSDLFESYIVEILGQKRPLIVLFLEQNLDKEDLQWKNDDGDNLFPFLSNLTTNSRVDYFQSVESPHQTVVQFAKKGYKLNSLNPDQNIIVNDGDLWVLEFGEDVSSRPETIRNHDQTMRDVYRQLVYSGRPWVAIYTAKHSCNRGFISDLMQLSPWHVEGEVQRETPKAVSLYVDDFTGFGLMTKGSIQLYLPSVRNLALKSLDTYVGASAKLYSKKTDFTIWFLNYSLTFHLTNQKGEWLIKSAKLLNGNGDSLNLTLRPEILPGNKCYVHLTEFQSSGKPIVKVKLSKYKFFRLQTHQELCAKPYTFYETLLLIFSCLIFTVICWNRLLQNTKFPRKSSHFIKISIEELMSMSTELLPYDF